MLAFNLSVLEKNKIMAGFTGFMAVDTTVPISMDWQENLQETVDGNPFKVKKYG